MQVILSGLKKFKEDVYMDPKTEIDDRIKKLRQANFKMQYKNRQQIPKPDLEDNDFDSSEGGLKTFIYNARNSVCFFGCSPFVAHCVCRG